MSRRLPDKIVPLMSGPTAPAEQVSTVSQDDKTFHPAHIALPRGARLWIVNNDTRTHNIRVFDLPALDFDSGAQEPGETVEIAFPAPARSWCSAASIRRWSFTSTWPLSFPEMKPLSAVAGGFPLAPRRAGDNLAANGPSVPPLSDHPERAGLADRDNRVPSTRRNTP